ncbi:unnamed protein product, partial [Phaeothamnion confervicola]
MRAFIGALGSALFFRDAGAATVISELFTLGTSTLIPSGTRRMEARFSPCSDHMFLIDKSGNFIAESTVTDELTFKFTIKNMVYEVADHGPTGMLIHPNFPTTPFIYIYYTADPANYWDDSCTLPPDPEGFSYCNV